MVALVVNQAQDGCAAVLRNTNYGLSPMRIAHAQYSFANDAGVQGLITPGFNFTIPANSVIYNVLLCSTTAVTSAGSATVSVGLTSPSAAASLVAATAKATWAAGAIVQGIPVPQTASSWIKVLGTPSQATVTIATADLTAGIIEIYVHYIEVGTALT